MIGSEEIDVSRPRGETALAIFTLALSLPYLIIETYGYISYVGFGNYFLGYFVDLIAITLMTMGGIASLHVRPYSAAGWLSGAWGFLSCLNLRSFAWRYYELTDNGTTGAEPDSVTYVLGFGLIISFGAFIYALYLSRPHKPKSPR